MNLTRALDVALPELPALRLKETYFRFNPATIHKTFIDKKQTTIVALAPATRKVFVLTPLQWELVQMFDGRRSYEQISALYKKKCGEAASPQAIEGFADSLDNNGFWFKTAQEESIALANELAEKRREHVKPKKSFDVSKMYLFTFDADVALTKLHRRVSFLYHPAFVIGSMVALMLMVGLWIARWDEVWRDSVMFWNMTQKSLLDILQFYVIFAVVGFFHESGHALTTKHFGGEVHRTGFMLVYTTPAFYVDSSEVWVNAGRWQRIATVLAGFWYELMLCALATFLWWGTAQGSAIHDLAYKVILVGGIMPVLFNMNPLMRLDGYLAFCEVVRVQNLREKANLFWSHWVQKTIFHLPVGVPHLPRRRAVFFAIFSVLSAVYTYIMLLFLARITYRIMLHITPVWAFLPATLIGLRIFKSRIVSFLKFLKTLYLHKKDFMLAHWKNYAVAVAVVVALSVLPIFRDKVTGLVILDPIQRAVVRSTLPARVDDVLVSEGETVAAGAPLFRLSDPSTESAAARARTELQIATAAETDARLRQVDFAAAQQERRRQFQMVHLSGERMQRLSLNSPIAGRVITPRVHDWKYAWVQPGTTLAEVDDESQLRARIYIDDADMRTLSAVSGHSIKLDSRLKPMRGKFLSISPTPQDLPPGLESSTAYKGLQPPPRYVVTVLLANDGSLRSGMTGEAKIYGRRRSLAGLVLRPVADFIARKIW